MLYRQVLNSENNAIYYTVRIKDDTDLTTFKYVVRRILFSRIAIMFFVLWFEFFFMLICLLLWRCFGRIISTTYCSSVEWVALEMSFEVQERALVILRVYNMLKWRRLEIVYLLIDSMLPRRFCFVFCWGCDCSSQYSFVSDHLMLLLWRYFHTCCVGVGGKSVYKPPCLPGSLQSACIGLWSAYFSHPSVSCPVKRCLSIASEDAERLTLWRLLLPYGYSYKASCVRLG